MAFTLPNITRTDENGNIIYVTDPNGNEIGSKGKLIAGVLLICTTVFTMILLLAHWPDKMPPLNEKASTKYAYKWFAVTYLDSVGINAASESLVIGANPTIKKDSPDVAKGTNNSTTPPVADSPGKNGATTPTVADSPSKAGDTTKLATTGTATKPAVEKSSSNAVANTESTASKIRTIDINILILLLVGLAGFLGNLVHIAASFTNFIGAGKFKRSWILWYCVKPFTAAALAVGVYIIFRAGFLNSGNVAASVNLYGVIAIAILAGLYTDMATQKLKEVFAVIFQTALTRPNPLDYPPLKITSADPNPLPIGEEKRVVLSGIGFGNRQLKFKINGTEIKDVVVNPNSIAFVYKADTEKPELVVFDEKGVEVTKYVLITVGQASVTSTITKVDPMQVTAGKAETIILTGTGLDATGITITMADTAVIPTSTSPTEIRFDYTPAESGTVELLVSDKDGAELKKENITVVAAAADPQQPTGIEITQVTPTDIVAGTPNDIKIIGSGLSTTGITVKVGAQDIDLTTATVTDTDITFSYTAADEGPIDLIVADKDGKEIKKTTITASAG